MHRRKTDVKYLILGVNGMAGHMVAQYLLEQKHDVTGFAKKESEKIMSKQIWRPGNMLYPVPAVLVSVADSAGNDNLITIAWTGTVCSDPATSFWMQLQLMILMWW